MNLTKKQKMATLDILHSLQSSDVPLLITCQEAAILCIRHGVTENKYLHYKNHKGYRRIDVAVYIARNGGSAHTYLSPSMAADYVARNKVSA